MAGLQKTVPPSIRLSVYLTVPQTTALQISFSLDLSSSRVILSKLYDVPVGFVFPTSFLGSVLLYLRSPKSGCCSISDDLCCYFRKMANPSLHFPYCGHGGLRCTAIRFRRGITLLTYLVVTIDTFGLNMKHTEINIQYGCNVKKILSAIVVRTDVSLLLAPHCLI